jgi:hypothetical protein
LASYQARRNELAQAKGFRNYQAYREAQSRQKGYARYSPERAAKEIRQAEEQQFTSRAEWRSFRREHKQALEDLRSGDTQRMWSRYEGGKNPNKHVRRAVDFAEMRSRIANIQVSRRKSWGEGLERIKKKREVTNAIMHDYVRQYHADLTAEQQERLVWDNEGNTP